MKIVRLDAWCPPPKKAKRSFVSYDADSRGTKRLLFQLTASKGTVEAAAENKRSANMVFCIENELYEVHIDPNKYGI